MCVRQEGEGVCETRGRHGRERVCVRQDGGVWGS